MATNPRVIGLDLLSDAPYGAYAVNLNQIIWYWNPAAERITGHKAWDVIGRPCFQVIQNLAEYGDAPVCQGGCPSLKATTEGRIPLVYHVWMLCASGERKLMIPTPLVIGAAEASRTMLVHLFYEHGNHSSTERAVETVETTISVKPDRETGKPFGESSQVTTRELEVLRLTALGMTQAQIARALHISYHTVRNHNTSLRRKLGAKNNLTLVLNAQNLGLL